MKFELNVKGIKVPVHLVYGINWTNNLQKLSDVEVLELCTSLLLNNIGDSKFVKCFHKSQKSGGRRFCIQWECLICGKVNETLVCSIVNAATKKCRCSAAQRTKKRFNIRHCWDIERVQNFLYKLYNPTKKKQINNYPILQKEYRIDKHRLYDGLWSNCGHSFKQLKLCNFYNLVGCKQCKRTSLEALHELELSLLTNQNIEAKCCIDYQQNDRSKIRCRCVKILKNGEFCNHSWTPTLNQLKHKTTGCPRCNKTSMGETVVAKILNNLNIVFDREYKIAVDERHINKMFYAYDFILPEHNILIEVNGKQHRENVQFYGNNLELQKQKDAEKDILAKEHGFNVIWVDYHGKTKKKLQEFECSVIAELRKYMNQTVSKKFTNQH